MKNSNKKKKLHFLFGDPLESFYQAIAIYLSRHYGFTEFSGLMWGHNQLRLLDRQKVNWTHIEVISDHIRTTLPSVKLDTNYLKEIEQKYGIPNFGLMIHSDRWFGKKPYKWVLKFLQMSVNLIERMYDKTQPDVVIIDPVADLMSYLHYVIAVEKGIPCYSITNSRMPDRISIDSGPYRLWKRVDQFFEEKLHRLSTTSELTKAETFLENFRQKKFRPLMGTQIHSTRDFFKYQYFLSFIRSITNWLMDPYNPVFYRPHQLIITHLSRLIRHAATRLLHYFEKPVSGEKYVLYPLHFEPEESTLIAAPYFVDQLSLIENIAINTASN